MHLDRSLYREMWATRRLIIHPFFFVLDIMSGLFSVKMQSIIYVILHGLYPFGGSGFPPLLFSAHQLEAACSVVQAAALVHGPLALHLGSQLVHGFRLAFLPVTILL